MAGSPSKWTQEVLRRRRDGEDGTRRHREQCCRLGDGPEPGGRSATRRPGHGAGRCSTASETRLRKVIDTAAEAIIIASGTGTIEQVNSSTVRLFGYTAEELIGQNLR